MPTFISYSQQDEAIYSAICLAFDAAEIDRWDSSTMAAGISLADQLNKAIQRCEICVFIATRHSIESTWCLAELGAFWGAGKRVIIFVTDSDLTDSVLPPQFKGNLRVHNAIKLIDSVKEALSTYWEKSAQIVAPQAFDFFQTSGDYGTESDWVKLLDETTHTFDILGAALNSWRTTKDITTRLLSKAKNGCKIRILFMHEDNQILNGLLYSGKSHGSVIHDITESKTFFSDLSLKSSNIKMCQMTQGIPHFFLTRTDLHAVIIQYTSSQTWGAGPTWRCANDTELYKIATKEFEVLWSSSEEKA